MTDYTPPGYGPAGYPPPAACPRCGSGANVLTIRQALDMMNSARDQAMQRAQPQGYNVPGAGPGAAPPPRPGFRVLGEGESPDAPRPGHRVPPPSRPSHHRDYEDSTGNLGEDIAGDIAGAVLSAGLGMLGRAIGRRVQKSFEERVLPAVQENAAQRQQEMEQVATRYPDLRICQHDQVVFLAGGHGCVPLSEIRMPVTMPQADAIVARLRG